MVKPLGKIEFGAPDANAEFVIASRTNSSPVFLQAYVDPPLGDIEGFRRGTRFLLLGLKGTGKTAVLRDLEVRARAAGRAVEFLIFRNEILEEKDLIDFNWPILIDDSTIKKTQHYLHCIKRIFLSIILKLCSNETTADIITFDDDNDRFFNNLYNKIRSSSASRLIQIAFDTIHAVLAGFKVDSSKITAGGVAIDASRILKRQNDILLENTIKLLRQTKIPLSLFVDEIHFAYRDEATLRQDAMLVRDTILAVINLNERFISEKIDCVIYAGFRSEFMDHPLIAAAEVNNALSSYGETLTWSTFPADSYHPMFDIAAKRIEWSTGEIFPKSKFIHTYFGAVDAQNFVEATWSKPRDIIRFFNIAKKMYPARISLLKNEFNAVLRQYAAEAWLEIKTAATAFLPPAGIVKLEEALRTIGPKTFEQDFRMTLDEFGQALDQVYNEISGTATSTYSKKHLVQLLFILGLFYTKRLDKGGQAIIYAYHRGNRHPAEDGWVYLHRSVARAFS